MQFTRMLSTDGTLRPAAVNFLDQIPPEALFHIQHQLRHPDSIYKLSLEKVGEAFSKVAEAYFSKTEEYRVKTSSDLEMSELLKLQESLLRAMQEHLESCWLILKTLVNPASVVRAPTFVEEYVLENRLPGSKSFRDAVADYKRSLLIANKLKHEQGLLRGVGIWLPGSVHLGYFLEAPDAQGLIGPSRVIHPDRGAISFARDLGWHLFNVYRCAEKLVKAVSRALDARGIIIQPRVCAVDKNWEKVVSLAVRIPAAIFPKELPKGVASFRSDNHGQTLTIRFPEHPKLKYPAEIKTTCSVVIDGHSRSYKVPLP
jgi:hypothetical protein